jgi:lysophospholipase L1-like esterase
MIQLSLPPAAGIEAAVERFPYRRVTQLIGLGDSVTAGSGASAPQYRWLNRLQAWTDTASGHSARLVNQGAAGDTSARMARRLAGLERGGLAVILAGLNDLRAGLAVDGFVDNLGALIDFYLPAAELVAVGSPPHIADYAAGGPTYDKGSPALHRQYAEAARQVCAGRGVVFADVYAAMGQDDGLVSADGVHPNDAGHLRIAEAFWGALGPYFSPAAPYVLRRPRGGTARLPVANPRFHSPLSEAWGAYQAAIAEESGTVFPGAANSARLTVSVSPGVLYTIGNQPGQRPAWSRLTSTLVEAWVRPDPASSPAACFVRCNQFDAGYSFISGSTVEGPPVSCPAEGWTRLTCRLTTHAECAGLEVGVAAQGAGTVVYVGWAGGWGEIPPGWA